MDSLPFEITVEELKTALDNQVPLRLIDCRESDEHALCKIEGAELVPLATIPEIIPAQISDRTTRIVVHCHHGMRSARATEYLRAVGYSNAQSLAGGIDAWSAKIDSSVPTY